jgi:hypothetical protein
VDVRADNTPHPAPPSTRSTGAVGNTTTTDPRSRRNRAGRGGRPATNASSRLIMYIGLPTLRAPGAPRPGWSHHTPGYRGRPSQTRQAPRSTYRLRMPSRS